MKAKLIVCFFLIAFVSFVITGCCRKSDREDLFDVAVNSIFNVTMSTNPLSAAYAPVGGSAAVRMRTDARYYNYSFHEGCPDIEFDGLFIPFLMEQDIAVTYDDNCTIDGMPVSGMMTGSWGVKWEGFTPTIRMEIGFTDFMLDTMVTNGSITAIPALSYKGPEVSLTGQINTVMENGDGDNRTLTYGDLTAVIDFNEEMWPFSPAGDDDDDTFLNPFDDTLVVNGLASYNDENQKEYSISFDNMTQNLACFFPDNGTMTVVNDETELDALVDFSVEDEDLDTFCDTLVNITIGDETRTYDLAKWIHGSLIPFVY